MIITDGVNSYTVIAYDKDSVHNTATIITAEIGAASISQADNPTLWTSFITVSDAGVIIATPPSAGEFNIWNGASWDAGTASPTPSSDTIKSFGITIDGGGSVITTGIKGYINIPFAMTVTRWDLFSDQTGDIVIDVWKDTIANFPPTTSIAGSEKPALSGATNNSDTSLSTWTTGIAANDVIGFNVDSAADVTRVTLTIQGIVSV